MKRPFCEPDCHVGGAWEEARLALREVARQHPQGVERKAASSTDDEGIEAVDELAEELAQGLQGTSPGITVDTALCRHPQTRRWAQDTTAPTGA